MSEHFIDDYHMSLIAGTNPNPRIDARWLVPTPTVDAIAEPEADEIETKVAEAPKRRGRRPANAEVETA